MNCVVRTAVGLGDRPTRQGGHLTENSVGELRHHRLEILLGHRTHRARLDVVDEEAGLDVDDLGE